jgi:hypothetical protein
VPAAAHPSACEPVTTATCHTSGTGREVATVRCTLQVVPSHARMFTSQGVTCLIYVMLAGNLSPQPD